MHDFKDEQGIAFQFKLDPSGSIHPIKYHVIC